MGYPKETICVAKINNELVEYDLCLNDRELSGGWIEDNFTFLGEGIIFSIDGVEQPYGEKKYFFWRKAKLV